MTKLIHGTQTDKQGNPLIYDCPDWELTSRLMYGWVKFVEAAKPVEVKAYVPEPAPIEVIEPEHETEFHEYEQEQEQEEIEVATKKAGRPPKAPKYK